MEVADSVPRRVLVVVCEERGAKQRASGKDRAARRQIRKRGSRGWAGRRRLRTPGGKAGHTTRWMGETKGNQSKVMESGRGVPLTGPALSPS